MQREFKAVFQISKLIMFNVAYYTLGDNDSPYFTTSANKFCRNKKDYSICGQAQEELLPKNSFAFKFWSKWDGYHLHKLTDEKLKELLADLEVLKIVYNYMYEDRPDDRSNYWSSSFYYSDIVAFSKQTPKKI